MQTLNEKQVVIQNTKTGKQSIVTRAYFEQQRKNNKVSPFHDFEIVPTATTTSEPAGTDEVPAKKSRAKN